MRGEFSLSGAIIFVFVVSSIVMLIVFIINKGIKNTEPEKPVDMMEPICYLLYAEKGTAIDTSSVVINKYKDKSKCERSKENIIYLGAPFRKAWCVPYECE